MTDKQTADELPKPIRVNIAIRSALYHLAGDPDAPRPLDERVAIAIELLKEVYNVI